MFTPVRRELVDVISGSLSRPTKSLPARSSRPSNETVQALSDKDEAQTVTENSRGRKVNAEKGVGQKDLSTFTTLNQSLGRFVLASTVERISTK